VNRPEYDILASMGTCPLGDKQKPPDVEAQLRASMVWLLHRTHEAFRLLNETLSMLDDSMRGKQIDPERMGDFQARVDGVRKLFAEVPHG
jgi:hypothetical protein